MQTQQFQNPFDAILHRFDNIENLLANLTPISPISEPLDRFVDDNEAQNITGFSNVTLWKMRRAGKLSVYKIGTKLRYKTSDLMALPKRIVTPQNK